MITLKSYAVTLITVMLAAQLSPAQTSVQRSAIAWSAAAQTVTTLKD